MKSEEESEDNLEKDESILQFFNFYGLSEDEDQILKDDFKFDDFEPEKNLDERTYFGLPPTDKEESKRREDDKNKRSTPRKYSKGKVDLSDDELQFKFSFYHLFVTKKKFEKKYVKLIHNLICDKLNISKLQREEERSIDLYFKNRIKYSNSILIYINTHKKEILDEIPELKN